MCGTATSQPSSRHTLRGPRVAGASERSHTRRQRATGGAPAGTAGAAVDGVAPIAARCAAPYQWSESSSASSASAAWMRGPSSRTPLAGSGHTGWPKRTVMSAPRENHERPRGIAANEPRMPMGTTGTFSVTARCAAVDRSAFDVVVDASMVEAPKPDAAAYRVALDRLGETATDCVALEDNVGGVGSAAAAGVACVAFPNENTGAHDFDAATQRVDAVDLGTLQQIIDGK